MNLNQKKNSSKFKILRDQILQESQVKFLMKIGGQGMITFLKVWMLISRSFSKFFWSNASMLPARFGYHSHRLIAGNNIYERIGMGNFRSNVPQLVDASLLSLNRFLGEFHTIQDRWRLGRARTSLWLFTPNRRDSLVRLISRRCADLSAPQSIAHMHKAHFMNSMLFERKSLHAGTMLSAIFTGRVSSCTGLFTELYNPIHIFNDEVENSVGDHTDPDGTAEQEIGVANETALQTLSSIFSRTASQGCETSMFASFPVTHLNIHNFREFTHQDLESNSATEWYRATDANSMLGTVYQSDDETIGVSNISEGNRNILDVFFLGGDVFHETLSKSWPVTCIPYISAPNASLYGYSNLFSFYTGTLSHVNFTHDLIYHTSKEEIDRVVENGKYQNESTKRKLTELMTLVYSDQSQQSPFVFSDLLRRAHSILKTRGKIRFSPEIGTTSDEVASNGYTRPYLSRIIRGFSQNSGYSIVEETMIADVYNGLFTSMAQEVLEILYPQFMRTCQHGECDCSEGLYRSRNGYRQGLVPFLFAQSVFAGANSSMRNEELSSVLVPEEMMMRRRLIYNMKKLGAWVRVPFLEYIFENPMNFFHSASGTMELLSLYLEESMVTGLSAAYTSQLETKLIHATREFLVGFFCRIVDLTYARVQNDFGSPMVWAGIYTETANYLGVVMHQGAHPATGEALNASRRPAPGIANWFSVTTNPNISASAVKSHMLDKFREALNRRDTPKLMAMIMGIQSNGRDEFWTQALLNALGETAHISHPPSSVSGANRTIPCMLNNMAIACFRQGRLYSDMEIVKTIAYSTPENIISVAQRARLRVHTYRAYNYRFADYLRDSILSSTCSFWEYSPESKEQIGSAIMASFYTEAARISGYFSRELTRYRGSPFATTEPVTYFSAGGTLHLTDDALQALARSPFFADHMELRELVGLASPATEPNLDEENIPAQVIRQAAQDDNDEDIAAGPPTAPVTEDAEDEEDNNEDNDDEPNDDDDF